MTGEVTQDPSLGDAIEAAAGQRPSQVKRLTGGDVGEVYKVTLKDGALLVAKVSKSGGLAVEGFMLGYLKMNSELPVPRVLHAADKLLLLEFVETSGGLQPSTNLERVGGDRVRRHGLRPGDGHGRDHTPRVADVAVVPPVRRRVSREAADSRGGTEERGHGYDE